MQLTLRIDGQDRTFSTTFIKGRMLREAVTLAKETNFDDLTEEALDKLVNYIVRVYDHQFTQDEFYDGIESHKMIEAITETIQGVVGTTAVEKAQQAQQGAAEPSGEVVALEKN
ncbi:hypothetical protein G3M81_12290 [Bacillus paralicheniformis]|uniref:phage tail assembly chaperone G n=1 Tax=Bacillus TaxID=1386 RepID=UPI0013EF3B88|nr:MULTISPECIES: hypothetical protein [Bacillus]MCY8609882.1 hypothetical protein [Bacillus haynesii]MEC0752114.1 hypothetical protein [Bacillus haynesii]QII49471.1 hypothetical protein G3M81_12290 [Bacillus paralicheniformis]